MHHLGVDRRFSRFVCHSQPFRCSFPFASFMLRWSRAATAHSAEHQFAICKAHLACVSSLLMQGVHFAYYSEVAVSFHNQFDTKHPSVCGSSQGHFNRQSLLENF